MARQTNGLPSPHFNLEQFDIAIADQGIPMVHYRALPCPGGLFDPDDPRASHADHDGCSNGFIYKLAGDVDCLFVGNSGQNNQSDLGQILGSVVRITPNRFYTGSDEEVVVAPFDRFYLKAVQAYSINWQLFEASSVGLDKLQYPVKRVEHLIDSDGMEYVEGTDFVVTDLGQIKWVGRQPGMQMRSDPGRGKVCGIRYRFQPFWYVKALDHEIRVAVGQDGVERMPCALVLQREIQFDAEQKDSLAPTPSSIRQAKGPRYGSMSPR